MSRDEGTPALQGTLPGTSDMFLDLYYIWRRRPDVSKGSQLAKLGRNLDNEIVNKSCIRSSCRVGSISWRDTEILRMHYVTPLISSLIPTCAYVTRLGVKLIAHISGKMACFELPHLR
jgi:hypothetical protein